MNYNQNNQNSQLLNQNQTNPTEKEKLIMKNTDNFRILANEIYRSNNSFETKLNNNDLIIGSTGAGKTRNYVRPNICCSEESMIITDTKGNLYQDLASELKNRGYRVENIDFKNPSQSTCGYNPIDYVRIDPITKSPNDMDLMTLSETIVPIKNLRDTYWDLSARKYFIMYLDYILRGLPPKEHNLATMAKLNELPLDSAEFKALIEEFTIWNENSVFEKMYDSIKSSLKADKMISSTQGILAENISSFKIPSINQIAIMEKRINFADLGKEKMALFINVSDSDRSQDKIINIFYYQAIHQLISLADQNQNSCLDFPVRFFLDDFAANTVIPDFDKTVSVIRSRGISVSIILQSIAQLNAMYGTDKAKIIVDNCDTLLFLGGQDKETISLISYKANKSPHTIMNMEQNQAWVFTRGQKGILADKFPADAQFESEEEYDDPEFDEFDAEMPF